MNFSCEGAVTSWIIGAEWVDGRIRYPEMQIWRLTQPSSSIDTYEIVDSIELRITEEISNEVYEYTVVTPMSFRAGDVIGMFEPNSAASRIQLYFKEGQGLTNYFAFSDIPFSFFTNSNMRQDDVYPLIAVVIGKTRAHSTDSFTWYYFHYFNFSSIKFSSHTHSNFHGTTQLSPYYCHYTSQDFVSLCLC